MNILNLGQLDIKQNIISVYNSYYFVKSDGI